MSRLGLIDRWRGSAIIMMVVFHGCYDLTYFGYAHFDMLGSPFWTTWRTVIVSLFVTLSGISLALSGPSASSLRFWRRSAQLLASACAVSMVTWVLFGSRWIYFGVLHFYWLASLITRPLLRWGPYLWLPALLLLGLGQMGWPSMDPRLVNWIGMAAHKPATEDYAPVLPWLGIFWLGVWAGQQPWLTNAPRRPPSNRADQGLQALGRHGLLIYLLHQPLLFAVFEGLTRLR